MSTTIYKYELKIGSTSIMIQPDARLLKVGQDPATGLPALWCEVDTTLEASEQHDFRVYGTGQDIIEPESERNYVGTSIGGGFVWHVFEVPTSQAKEDYAAQLAQSVQQAAAEIQPCEGA